MYGGIPPRFCAPGVQTAMWLFLTRILAWKRISAISYMEGLLFLEIKILNYFDIHCVTEASNFSLNHNLALECKQKSLQDPQTVQNSFVFLPEL